MTTQADLLADLGMGVVGADSPEVFDLPGDLSDLVVDVLRDQGDRLAEALEAIDGDEWELLVVASTAHPHLGTIHAWCHDRPDVILLASPAGPRPPAVVTFERTK